mmetsp:Transcript_15280/g.35413  ORF Transcript_15280/g.35413 Transcript_15280/m.35413 type:complete len:236 (-) Transcript_15280:190-897(-)
MEDPVPQKGDGDLVQASDDHVGGRPGGSHAIQRGKIQEKANQAGEDVLGSVVHRVQDLRLPKELRLAEIHRRREQKADTQNVVVKNHCELFQLDVFRRVLHVENVSRTRDAVQEHPRYAPKAYANVVLGGGDGSQKHDSKGDNHQVFWLVSEDVVVSDRCRNVRNVFEDGNHGYRVVLEGRHASKQHRAKEDVDGGPLLCNLETEGGNLDPVQAIADVDGHDRHDRLEDHQRNVE